MAEKFIQKAIKRPGRLTEMVGGAPGEHMGEVRRIASSARNPKDRAAARFFLGVLSKVGRRKGGGPPAYRGRR